MCVVLHTYVGFQTVLSHVFDVCRCCLAFVVLQTTRSDVGCNFWRNTGGVTQDIEVMKKRLILSEAN